MPQLARTGLLGACALAALAMGSAIWLQPVEAEGQPNVMTEKKDRVAAPDRRGRALEHRALALQLAAWARDNGNAAALAVAASIARDNAPTEPRFKPIDEQSAQPASGSMNDKENTPEGMLSEAKTLAKNDQTVVALIDRIASESTRGHVEGPGCWKGSVAANQNRMFTGKFKGADANYIYFARASLLAADSDVDLWIYDSGNNLICASIGTTGREFCEWIPIKDGDFNLWVANQGKPKATNFELCTN